MQQHNACRTRTVQHTLGRLVSIQCKRRYGYGTRCERQVALLQQGYKREVMKSCICSFLVVLGLVLHAVLLHTFVTHLTRGFR
jgi:hypothetical protein